MLTLFRWLMLKSKQTKCRLAFWTLMEQLLTEAADQSKNSRPEPEGGGKDT